MSVLYPDLPYTNFPGQVDNITYMMNITASDLPNINLFHYYLRNGDFAAAQQILRTIPDSDKKIIDSSRLNQFRDAMIALERFYKTDIQPYVATKQAEWQAILDRFTYGSTWVLSNTYYKNTMVSYNIDTDTYIYIASQDVPANTPITNTDYWTVLTMRGARGVSGTNGAYRYNWLASETYDANDVVSYNNALWIANNTNTGSIPSNSNSDWDKLFDLPPVVVPLQATEPVLNSGEIYFDIS